MAGVRPDASLEPTEADVDLALAAQTRLGETGLGPASGGERCGACRHFLTPGDPVAFCWHPAQRCLVADGWVCDAFVADPDR